MRNQLNDKRCSLFLKDLPLVDLCLGRINHLLAAGVLKDQFKLFCITHPQLPLLVLQTNGSDVLNVNDGVSTVDVGF